MTAPAQCGHPLAVYKFRRDAAGIKQVFKRCCWRCGELLAMGEANDTPQVQLEIRATDLALWSTIDGLGESCGMTATELSGWCIHRHVARVGVAVAPVAENELGGWLASELATHGYRSIRDAASWTWDVSRPIADQVIGSVVDRIAEQTRHDVAASVVRHGAHEPADTLTRSPPSRWERT